MRSSKPSLRESSRRVVAHVFVEDLGADRPALSQQDVHHLSRVLRLRPGETVSLSDGRGGLRVGRWAGGPSLDELGELVYQPLASPALTVGFALTKGDHPEQAVRELTEAGVDRVVVLVSERCVVRWPVDKVARQLERLREVARQAAMQSRRAWLPVVEGPVAFAALTATDGALTAPSAGGLTAPSAGVPTSAAASPSGLPVAAVALAVPGGGPISLSTPTVLIGPEGGWTEAEMAAVPDHVGLGPHVLRAETAAVAAGVLLAALRAGLVAGGPPGAGRS